MTNNAYSIFDVKSDSYSPPFFMLRDGMALRAFMDLANGRDTMVGKHPEDYKLVCVGTFDDVSGVLESVSPFRSLGFASDYVNRASGPVLASVPVPDKKVV